MADSGTVTPDEEGIAVEDNTMTPMAISAEPDQEPSGFLPPSDASHVVSNRVTVGDDIEDSHSIEDSLCDLLLASPAPAENLSYAFRADPSPGVWKLLRDFSDARHDGDGRHTYCR